MDNFALEALIREITPTLLQTRIQKIKRIGETGFALGLRPRTNESLVVSLEQSYPTVFLSDTTTSPPAEASDWLLTLRKYVLGGKILSLQKEFSERKVFFELEKYRHSVPEKLFLALELIPAKTNAFLLNQNQEVLASFYPGSTYSRRPGAPETHPQASWAIDRITEANFHQWIQASRSLDNGSVRPTQAEQIGSYQPAAVFRSQSARHQTKLAGMSRYFVQEILCDGSRNPESIWERFQMLLKRVRQGPYLPQIYYLKDRQDSSAAQEPKEGSKCRGATRPFVSPFPLDSLSGVEHAQFPSLNAAATKAYEINASNASLRAGQNSQLSRVDALLRKRTRLLKNLQEDLRKSETAQVYKKYADLIYAHNDKSPPGQRGLRLADLFDPDQKEIEVPLDPKLSLIQNAVHYSKLYQKARRSVPLIIARLEKTEQEIKLLTNQKQGLASATTLAGLLEATASREAQTNSRETSQSARAGVTASLDTTSRSKTASNSLLRKTAKSFVSSDGLVILVGKSSRDNDTLTLKIAQSDDFWFHVADYGGSHVVLKNPERLAVLPRQSLLEAARLAAYFSQARNASRVEVHYTQKKFVSKPKGAKPGLVRLKEFRSVLVEPQLLTRQPA